MDIIWNLLMDNIWMIYTSTSHSQDFTEGSFAQPCWSKIKKKFLMEMVDAIEKAQAIGETQW